MKTDTTCCVLCETVSRSPDLNQRTRSNLIILYMLSLLRYDVFKYLSLM